MNELVRANQSTRGASEIDARVASRLRTCGSSPTSNSTAKRLAHLVALSRSTQGYFWRFFHSQYPLRFRSWLRPSKLCLSKFGSMAMASKHLRRGGVTRRSSRSECDTLPKSPPSAGCHMPLAVPCRPSRHLRPMLQFPFWRPNDMRPFRVGGVEPESSLPSFSRLQARV